MSGGGGVLRIVLIMITPALLLSTKVHIHAPTPVGKTLPFLGFWTKTPFLIKIAHFEVQHPLFKTKHDFLRIGSVCGRVCGGMACGVFGRGCGVGVVWVWGVEVCSGGMTT